MISKKNISIILIFLIFISIFILYKKSEENINVEAMKYYLNLQEEIIDEEAHKKILYKKNLELTEKLIKLQDSINKAILDLEKKNHKEEFFQEIPHPMDRIKNEQIEIYDRKVVLNVEGAKWRYMIDSNSMDPLLDLGSSIITITPKTENDLKIGDIIVFKANFSEYDVVHRIINITKDANETYFITKGDNVEFQDPSKIKFEEIIEVVIGILY